jgi:hypothetical protein
VLEQSSEKFEVRQKTRDKSRQTDDYFESKVRQNSHSRSKTGLAGEIITKSKHSNKA